MNNEAIRRLGELFERERREPLRVLLLQTADRSLGFAGLAYRELAIFSLSPELHRKTFAWAPSHDKLGGSPFGMLTLENVDGQPSRIDDPSRAEWKRYEALAADAGGILEIEPDSLSEHLKGYELSYCFDMKAVYWTWAVVRWAMTCNESPIVPVTLLLGDGSAEHYGLPMEFATGIPDIWRASAEFCYWLANGKTDSAGKTNSAKRNASDNRKRLMQRRKKRCWELGKDVNLSWPEIVVAMNEEFPDLSQWSTEDGGSAQKAANDWANVNSLPPPPERATGRKRIRKGGK